jgi:hypothetical protein
MIRENATYKLIRFVKSDKAGKKYTAVLKNKKTGGEKRVHFGASAYEQYRDTTGVGAWSHKNHLDEGRRSNYRSRHAGEGNESNFPNAGYFAYHTLW